MLHLRAAFVLSISALSMYAQDASEWAWVDFAVEGTLTKMDAELAPRLREGMVFSAIYSVAAEAEAVDLDPAASRARYFDVVDDVEVSIDLNYVLAYEASTGMGDRWIELTRAGGDLEVDQDLYSILLPLKGKPIGEEGWSARWLQIWFYDEGEKMFPSTALQAPPDEFRSGWWRITFWNTEGSRSVLAEGAIEVAGEAGEPLSPSEQIAQLEEVVLRMGRRLEAELSQNQALAAELASAQSRIQGLQKTVDVIFEERRILQDKYDLLKLEKTEAAPELVDQVASLEADLALWSEKESAWEAETRALAEALALAESESSSLAEALSEVEAKLTKASAAAPGVVSEAETVSAQNQAPVVPQVAEEKPVVLEEEEKKARRSAFRRPGKFSR